MTRFSPLRFNEQDGSIAFRDLLTIGVGPVCLEPSDVRNPSQKSVTYACEVDRRWRPRGVTRHGLPNESVQPSGWALVLNIYKDGTEPEPCGLAISPGSEENSYSSEGSEE